MPKRGRPRFNVAAWHPQYWGDDLLYDEYLKSVEREKELFYSDSLSSNLSDESNMAAYFPAKARTISHTSMRQFSQTDKHPHHAHLKDGDKKARISQSPAPLFSSRTISLSSANGTMINNVDGVTQTKPLAIKISPITSNKKKPLDEVIDVVDSPSLALDQKYSTVTVSDFSCDVASTASSVEIVGVFKN